MSTSSSFSLLFPQPPQPHPHHLPRKMHRPTPSATATSSTSSRRNRTRGGGDSDSTCSSSTSSSSTRGRTQRVEASTSRGRKRVKGDCGIQRATRSSLSPAPSYHHLPSASYTCPSSSAHPQSSPRTIPLRLPRRRSNSTPPQLLLPPPPPSPQQQQPTSSWASSSSSSTANNWYPASSSSLQTLNASVIERESRFLEALRLSSSSSISSPSQPHHQTQPPSSWDTAISTSFGTSSFEFSFVVPPPLPSPNQLPTTSIETPGLTFSEGSSVVSDFELVEDELEVDLIGRKGSENEVEGQEDDEDDEEEEEEMVLVSGDQVDGLGLGGRTKGGKVDELSSMLRRTHLPRSSSHRQSSWTEEQEEFDMGGLFD